MLNGSHVGFLGAFGGHLGMGNNMHETNVGKCLKVVATKIAIAYTLELNTYHVKTYSKVMTTTKEMRGVSPR